MEVSYEKMEVSMSETQDWKVYCAWLPNSSAFPILYGKNALTYIVYMYDISQQNDSRQMV